MDLTHVIDPLHGRPMWAVGSGPTHLQATHRGYCVSLEWLAEGNSRDVERVLCIWPLAQERNSGVWAICGSAAVKYAHFDTNGKPTGTPTVYAWKEARTTLTDVFDRVALGIEIAALLDVVMRYLPELVLMPPAPRGYLKDTRQPLFEVTQKVDGKVIQQDHV
jgi:hypothetical protein